MSPAALLTAGLTAPAAALLVPARVGVEAGSTPLDPRARRSAVALAAALLVLLGWWLLDLHQLLLAGLGTGLALATGSRLRRRRARAVAAGRSERVLAACEAMAADLGAGQPPLSSLELVAADWSALAPVAAAARMGADVPSALRELADQPGAAALRTVAATWQVAGDTGAGLAAALARAAEGIRAERRTARLVAAELAAARATARVLAVLPLGVLLLGIGIGGDPLGFLLDTVPGLAVLALGTGLCLAGLAWLDRIADAVLRQ